MFKKVTFALLCCFMVVSANTLKGYDEEEGVVGELGDFLSDFWRNLKKDARDVFGYGKEKFKDGSKVLLGRRRHNTLADYIEYLKDQAKKAGTSVADFVQKNLKELKKELNDEEYDEVIQTCSKPEKSENDEL